MNYSATEEFPNLDGTPARSAQVIYHPAGRRVSWRISVMLDGGWANAARGEIAAATPAEAMPARRRRRRRPSARWTSASSIRSRFREGFGYPATCSDAVEKSKCVTAFRAEAPFEVWPPR
jgi:hypothetical protein